MTLEWKSYLQTMEHFDIMLIFAVVTSHVYSVIKVIVDHRNRRNRMSGLLFHFCFVRNTHRNTIFMVRHMQSKDDTSMLAKDVCKRRTHSEKTYTGPLSLLLDCREATKCREKVIFK